MYCKKKKKTHSLILNRQNDLLNLYLIQSSI